MKKKGNKKEKLTESLQLTVKIARRSNENMTLVPETSHTVHKITVEATKWL